MVSVAAAFVVGAVIWLVLLQPLYSGSAQLATRVDNKTAQLADLQSRVARMPKASANKPVQGANQSLVVIIDRTTRERSLEGYLKRNQPEGTNTVRLRFENAPFDDLVTWMASLRSDYGLRATSASMDLAGPPGRINASLVLAR